MILYAIRHGESLANATAAHAGWAQVPLTEKGIEQAKRTAALIQDVRFDKVITSDLLRAIQTAEYALPGCRKERDARLREISVGSLSGRFLTDCEAELGSLYLRHRHDHNFTAYGGENMDDLRRRVADFLNDLCQEPADSKIAVVCHEGSIFAMLCHVLQCSLPRHAAAAANCSVSVFAYENGRWSLCKWNETGSAEI